MIRLTTLLLALVPLIQGPMLPGPGTLHAAAASISFVQENDAKFVGTSPISLSLPANVTAGNSVLVMVGKNDNAKTITSVVDGNSAAYSAVTFTALASAICNNGSGGGQSVYQLANSVGGASARTITVTFSAAPSGSSITIVEVHRSTSAMIDKAECVAQTNPGTGANAVSSPSVTPSTSGEMILGFALDGGFANNTWTAGTNVAWAFPGTMTNPSVQANEFFIQSSAAAVSAKFTTNQGISFNTTSVVALNP